MPAATAVPQTVAAHCRECNNVFTAEPRDVVLGEIYCPSCTARTEPEDRDSRLADLVRRFPTATPYAPGPDDRISD